MRRVEIVGFACSLHRAKVELEKRGVGFDCRFQEVHSVWIGNETCG